MSEFKWLPTKTIRYWRPLFKVVSESAELGYFIGTEAAKYQGETGIAGQTGYGGGAWTPEGVQQEMNYITVGGIGGGLVV